MITYKDLLIPDGSSQAIKTALDDVYSKTAVGPLSTAIADSFYGINHRQQPNSVPLNKDYHGLTFFTRPRLNMTRDNLRQVRRFTPLLTNESMSIPRAVRAMLDTDAKLYDHTSPLMDDYQAFIPILTNQLITISGWPDIVAPTYTSKPGAYKEAFSLVDGVTDYYETYDIQANFRNIQGDPITALFLTWVHYQSMVAQGIMVPYPDMIYENEVDYNTRIYRLIMDPSKRFVQKIAACGAAFPISVPIGAQFNVDTDAPIARATDQISMTFRCTGAMYQDDILIDEFNSTVEMQNTEMRGSDANRARSLVKLAPEMFNLFNHRGYPRINPISYELEWWVPKEDYDAILGSVEDDGTEDPLSRPYVLPE